MKRTLLSISALAAGLLIFAVGCKKVDSNDLKDSVPFYQEYAVTYDKTAATTSATALLRVRSKDGSRVELTNGAYIRANGVDENDAQPTNNTYDWFFTGTKDVRFDLGKNSGTVIANIISLTEVGAIDFPGNMLTGFSKGEGYSFNWIGAELAADEELSVTLTGTSTQSALVPWTNKVNLNGNQVIIDSTSVNNIATGSVTLKMMRTRTTALDASDAEAGGNIKVTATTSRVLMMGN